MVWANDLIFLFKRGLKSPSQFFCFILYFLFLFLGGLGSKACYVKGQ